MPPPSIPAPPPSSTSKWQCSPNADKAMEDGNLETGLHEHARFVANHPGNPLAHYHLGYAFGQLGDIQQEIAHYETAVALGYTYDDQLYFNLAMAYAELALFERAIDAFKQGLRLAPDAIDTLTELTRIYREIGDIENERSTLEHLLMIMPQSETGSIKQRLKELSED